MTSTPSTLRLEVPIKSKPLEKPVDKAKSKPPARKTRVVKSEPVKSTPAPKPQRKIPKNRRGGIADLDKEISTLLKTSKKIEDKKPKKEFKLAEPRPKGTVAKPTIKSATANVKITPPAKSAPKKEEKRERKITTKSVGLDVNSELTKFENNNQEEYNKIQNFIKKNEKKNFIYPLELTSFITKPNNEKIFKELKYNAKDIFDFYTLLANDIIENNDLKLTVLRALDKDPKNISVASKKKLVDSIKKNPDIESLIKDKNLAPKKDDIAEGLESMVKLSKEKDKKTKVDSSIYKDIVMKMKALLNNRKIVGKINQLVDDGKSFGKFKTLKNWFDENFKEYEELLKELELIQKQNKKVKMSTEQEMSISSVQDFFESNRFYSK